ncbi:hypothetical protein EB118_17445 [bacterium]|nr:hypothetical protein [bacterium]NDG31843.1 hypothetical protein [bacterium]
MIIELNEDTFDEYAVKNYRNPNCTSVLEFLDDLKTIKYVKRLINKYVAQKDLKERLILNHIISLSNVFGVEATVNMLHYKIEKRNHHVLNAFFLFLNYIETEDLEFLDLNLYNSLKKKI